MAWETRARGSRYYTRSRMVNGRVVREYVGGGLAGELAADTDARERQARQEQRQAFQARQRADASADALLAGLIADVDLATRAALLAAGYHQHDRGEWRRRRG